MVSILTRREYDDKHQGNKKINWRSGWTWLKLIIVIFQLSLVSSVAAAIPLGIATRYEDSNQHILMIFVAVTAILLWLILFYGWLYNSRLEYGPKDTDTPLKFTSGSHWALFVVWACIIIATTFFLTLYLLRILGLGLPHGVPLIVGAGIATLTAKYSYHYIELQLLSSGR